MSQIKTSMAPGYPSEQGLYDPANEHDACGFGFIANIHNEPSHEIVHQALGIVVNMDHRGAIGADPLAGDGAGILIQQPHAFHQKVFGEQGITVPDEGDYAVGMVFLPRDEQRRAKCVAAFNRVTAMEGQALLGWRDVPVDNSVLGETVKPNEPVIRQILIGKGPDIKDTAAFERKLYVIRKQAHHAIWDYDTEAWRDFYVPSLAVRTIVFKGMVLAPNLAKYYVDFQDPDFQTAMALFHQRFSTNTFPSWRLAQPFRYLSHNGEINTLRGNINWMNARRHNMSSKILGEDLEKLWPLIGDGSSDSSTFDNALELLVMGGYSLAHAMMLMIPEAWADNPLMDEDRRAFYEFQSALMEPWDGPAAMAFSDGRQIAATLDRNGLRPARYVVTDDGLVVMSSEVGVIDIPEEKIVKKWRLQPGKMLLIDLEEHRIISDDELKTNLATARPYKEWLEKNQIMLSELPAEVGPMTPDPETLLNLQQSFGYTREDIGFFFKPMATSGQDPIGSMGRDIPVAPLSDKSRMLYDYFAQNFAQVTNPPIDPIREELVMSLVSFIGPRPNLLDLDSGGTQKRLEVPHPILTNTDLERIRRIENHLDGSFRTYTLDICYSVEDGKRQTMAAAIDALCERAEKVVGERGYNILILSDRGMDADNIAIPALLATGAVHHHLIRKGLRTSVGIVVETGEARRVHDFCLLAGYGAEAMNPYLAFDTLANLRMEFGDDLSEVEAHKRYVKAINKGMLKVMSKMGISTYQSYCGAQIFDAVGLSSDFVNAYFTGTATKVEGVGIEEIARETEDRHTLAFSNDPDLADDLDAGGDLAYRLGGEEHVWTPESVSTLQHAVRKGDYGMFKVYSSVVNEQSVKFKNLRGLFELKPVGPAVPLDEVEPIEEIFKRFATGAMSFGSISWEAHTTLAIAMNRIGGKSNTGEGGEEAERYELLPNGDSMRSAIKQVASGRFGVTNEYLANADDIQIKMAQGAKPGEGGQLPGDKVNEWIARVRHSTPGVGLISPPPHHDIYSIEDLSQLIHDLKNVNPEARISVKLVSEVGVGTVAAGVSKAHADHVTISGHDGGTGASPITSLLSAGGPWEIGLAEAHQTLLLNQLRGRIAVQVDGGLRTGRDVIVGALLGADEFGFATAALVSEGCIMMRKCHLNTCPVGVATQDEKLRKRFTGDPDHVVNFFTYIAMEIRELMAELGFRTFNEMIGRTDALNMRGAINHWKAQNVDLSKLLHRPDVPEGVSLFNNETQDHGLESALDHELIKQAKPALENGDPVSIEAKIINTNRTVGAMLSGVMGKKFGNKGLPDDTINIKLTGSAGQSFGGWLARGVSMELSGDANDYVGKGLSGGRISIRPSEKSSIVAHENIIAGNTLLYGAISGECYIQGVVGERFAVRNSGATSVVEGCGDHGCEYMTGGVVAVLGKTGRNFAAGMSGGIAYVLDEDGGFETLCNMSMVDIAPIADEERFMKEEEAQSGDLESHGLVDISSDMTRYDVERLHDLIENHLQYTNSARAKDILDNWNDYLPKFVKVMPIEYRRVLQEMQARSQASERDGVSLAVGG
jgi:glutamate synthase (NADPH/NADH) large chain